MIMAMIIFMVIISLLLQLVEDCWRHSGLSGSSPSPSPPKRSHIYSTQWWSPWLWWSSSSPLIRGLLTSSWPLWAPQGLRKHCGPKISIIIAVIIVAFVIIISLQKTPGASIFVILEFINSETRPLTGNYSASLHTCIKVSFPQQSSQKKL